MRFKIKRIEVFLARWYLKRYRKNPGKALSRRFWVHYMKGRLKPQDVRLTAGELRTLYREYKAMQSMELPDRDYSFEE